MDKTIQKIVLGVLEQHDGACMDNTAEREQMAESLANALDSNAAFMAMLGLLDPVPFTEEQHRALTNGRLICCHGSEEVDQVELAHLLRNVKRVENGVVISEGSYAVEDESSAARWYECNCRNPETGGYINTIFLLPDEVSEDWE